MRIITISGLDGSGKSTQLELLKNHLEKQGKNVFYFHAIRFGLANNLSGKKEPDKSQSVVKSGNLKIALRKIFLTIDLWRFRKLRNKLQSSGYDYIVSDRYFYDSIINIAYLSKDTAYLRRNFRSLIVPDKGIYLNVEPALIMSRERKPDQGLSYLQEKKALYDQAAELWKLHPIDGNSAPEAVFREIKTTLGI